MITIIFPQKGSFLISKYLWVTDSHLDFLNSKQIEDFVNKLLLQNPKCLLLTGDISNGSKISEHLSYLVKKLNLPIYFVLGNHDFGYAGKAEVLDKIDVLTKSVTNLYHLNQIDWLPLEDGVCLIGDHGWYDSRWRQPWTSLVFLWDYFLIKEFWEQPNNASRLMLSRAWANQAAVRLGNKLIQALQKNNTVYCLTHFPPWPEKNPAWGGYVDKFWVPYNSSKTMADYLSKIMSQYPSKKLIVLTGHVHPARTYSMWISNNIECVIGRAGALHLLSPANQAYHDIDTF